MVGGWVKVQFMANLWSTWKGERGKSFSMLKAFHELAYQIKG
jgi:hypothetical protein